MILNAALHLLSFLVGGFNPHTIQFIFVGILYGAIAYGLLRGVNLLACITFVIALVGVNAAYIGMGYMQIPDWWLGLIVLLDALIAFVLFFYIWKR